MTKPLMQLGPGPWRIVLTGDTDAFLSAGGRDRSILRHALDRMVAGETFSLAELAYWAIEVEQVADPADLAYPE